MVRTRFAPSPTGYMHIGNLRTALYEYLIAKSAGGTFILRIEDTDKERFVEGATDVIYKTLQLASIVHDEGPDVGGDFGPYIQSERKSGYLDYAKMLIEKGEAYYCFCTKERLTQVRETSDQYDRHCLSLSKEQIEKNLADGIPYVIRQKMPTTGQTTFHDEVYGDITVENGLLEDQILIKSDSLPTYNFANVVDDHLMKITHVVRGSEYLSSTPKYNLLYEAFGWDIPTYVHVPPVMKSATEKLSKRNGDASFEDLIEMGYLPEAIVNYVALLGWSPSDNQEIFTLDELIQAFTIKNLSKSPSIFDMKKLSWMNSEYLKKMDKEVFYDLALPFLQKAVTRDVDLKLVASYIQTRLDRLNDIPSLVDFIDVLPSYDIALYVHKKMKTDETNSLHCLQEALPVLSAQADWSEQALHDTLMALIATLGVKNGQMLWPIRTALSGRPTSPCGAIELLALLNKEESLARIETGIALLSKAE